MECLLAHFFQNKPKFSIYGNIRETSHDKSINILSLTPGTDMTAIQLSSIVDGGHSHEIYTLNNSDLVDPFHDYSTI